MYVGILNSKQQDEKRQLWSCYWDLLKQNLIQYLRYSRISRQFHPQAKLWEKIVLYTFWKVPFSVSQDPHHLLCQWHPILPRWHRRPLHQDQEICHALPIIPPSQLATLNPNFQVQNRHQVVRVFWRIIWFNFHKALSSVLWSPGISLSSSTSSGLITNLPLTRWLWCGNMS